MNVAGSFALGLLWFSGDGTDALLFAGVGICGSYTTYSSFAFDTVRLAETGRLGRGVANAAGTLLAAVGEVLAWSIVG